VKLFVDSNVLIAALRGSALCRQLLFQVQEATRQELFISDTVLSEAARILRHKMGVPPEVIATQLAQVAELLQVATRSSTPIPCPDPDDGWVLADAV
jgi:predicted nucleic acid-binding protein